MVGRLFWVLARDDATPFSKYFSQVNERLSCPIPATILCAVMCTAVGAIQLGSTTAFNSLVGSFIILTTGSYLLAILPHLLSKRKNTPRGPFWMGDLGFAVNGIACVLIVFFNIFFCFPYAYPVEPISAMNCKSSLPYRIALKLTVDREFRHLRGGLLDHCAVVDAWFGEGLLGTKADCDLRKQLRELWKRSIRLLLGYRRCFIMGGKKRARFYDTRGYTPWVSPEGHCASHSTARRPSRCPSLRRCPRGNLSSACRCIHTNRKDGLFRLPAPTRQATACVLHALIQRAHSYCLRALYYKTSYRLGHMYWHSFIHSSPTTGV